MSKEERFALDNNNYIIDFDESCKTYCLTQEQVCEILNKQTQRITDLEAKLAESEEAIKCLKGIKRYDIGELLIENTKLKQQLAEKEKEKIEYTDTINFVETSEPDIVAKELDRLNQQLAEKEKEIEELLNYDRCSHCSYGQANKEYREKCSELIEKLAEVENSCDCYMNRANDLLLKDQDKISFAVEQLQKVQSYLKEKNENETWQNKVADEERDDIAEYIDNQIKQLKEMK